MDYNSKFEIVSTKLRGGGLSEVNAPIESLVAWKNDDWSVLQTFCQDSHIAVFLLLTEFQAKRGVAIYFNQNEEINEDFVAFIEEAVGWQLTKLDHPKAPKRRGLFVYENTSDQVPRPQVVEMMRQFFDFAEMAKTLMKDINAEFEDPRLQDRLIYCHDVHSHQEDRNG